MHLSNLWIGILTLGSCVRAQEHSIADHLEVSAIAKPRFSKISKWQFPKNIKCTIQAINLSTRVRDIPSAAILRAVQNQDNHNFCVDNKLKAELGTKSCTLTYTPPKLAGDPASGWNPIYIDYVLFGNSDVAGMRFRNGYIDQVGRSRSGFGRC